MADVDYFFNRLEAAEKVIEAMGHETDCKFTGCTCGRTEKLKLALAEWARIKQEGPNAKV